VIRVWENGFASGALIAPPWASLSKTFFDNLSLLTKLPLNVKLLFIHQRLARRTYWEQFVNDGLGVVSYNLLGHLTLLKEPRLYRVSRVSVKHTWADLFEEIETDKFLEKF